MSNKDLIKNSIKENITEIANYLGIDIDSTKSKQNMIKNDAINFNFDELFELTNKEFAIKIMDILKNYITEDVLEILLSDEKSNLYTKHLRAILKDVTDVESEEEINKIACNNGNRLRYYKEPKFDLLGKQCIISNDWYYQTHNDYDNRTPFVNFVRNIVEKANEKVIGEKYDKMMFLNEAFLEESKYNTIISLLNKKKNIILQGAPGVGKTFIAKRLAYSIIGSIDKSKVELIQFHQSYSYEDFVEGYRPTENGFELKKGIFYNFCKKAKLNPEEKYFLIIDEINRGNLSKIFGELLMLIENDKRGDKLRLEYSEELFSVPKNLYIIGLMNTADRSLALIDYALRRRFSFVTIEPAFSDMTSEASKKFFEKYHSIFGDEHDNVINLIKELNDTIKNDPSLGEGFAIGHSYFCPAIKPGEGTINDLKEIIDYEIIPLLEEYWYDDERQKRDWINRLNNLGLEV